jgi:hypothetical protein
MAALFSYDPSKMEASDDDMCLTCQHHETDHLLLDEAEYGDEIKAEWDGRCLVEGCGCKNYR